MRAASGCTVVHSQDEGAGRRPVVLLLEDEPLLAMTLSDYIDAAGCEVVQVNTTEWAIRVLEDRTDIRIVVADLDTRGSVMGLTFAAHIRDRWPPIELILTSSAPRAPRAGAMPARGLYFGKPFDGRAMVSAIRDFAGHAPAA
ncbi:hypothetical protein FOHLNKBM_4947 [Methylobacterium longum]|nr:hypothetical protein FOHLNKBM_4947 [Methylobacterium longum]